MAKNSYANKSRGKSKLPPFLRVERELFNSEVWSSLAHATTRVYLCIRCCENGKNKDNLKVSYSYIKKHGVKSSSTISKSLEELEEKGLIVKVKQGGLFQQSNIYKLSTLWKA